MSAPEALHLARQIGATTDRSRVVQQFRDGGGDTTYVSPSTGYRARAFGVASTCTAGPDGAVHNWVQNVLRRSEKS